MDTPFHSTVTSFTFPLRNPITNSSIQNPFFSSIRSHYNKKLKTCSTLSSSTPQNFHRNFNTNRSYPNPIWVLARLLQKIKSSAFSLHSSNWVSSVQSISNLRTDEILQNGGLGVALLTITSNAKIKISPFVATLAANPTFVSGLLAWFIAQSTKVILNFFVEKKWDLTMLFASGGMPSSHSALCTALTASVALRHGVSDSLFPVCLGFSCIVMYDATGVRRHAGMQAEVLNMIVEDLFQGHPISERKLKELLGHTPSQVLAGALLGIIVAYVCCRGCLVAA